MSSRLPMGGKAVGTMFPFTLPDDCRFVFRSDKITVAPEIGTDRFHDISGGLVGLICQITLSRAARAWCPVASTW